MLNHVSRAFYHFGRSISNLPYTSPKTFLMHNVVIDIIEHYKVSNAPRSSSLLFCVFLPSRRF